MVMRCRCRSVPESAPDTLWSTCFGCANDAHQTCSIASIKVGGVDKEFEPGTVDNLPSTVAGRGAKWEMGQRLLHFGGQQLAPGYQWHVHTVANTKCPATAATDSDSDSAASCSSCCCSCSAVEQHARITLSLLTVATASGLCEMCGIALETRGVYVMSLPFLSIVLCTPRPLLHLLLLRTVLDCLSLCLATHLEF